MIKQDIRWQQRFSNYRKALAKLIQAVDLLSVQIERDESVAELLQEGLIQRFEYTHELAWKVMKDYAEYQGYTDVRGSRDAIRKALEMNLIDDRRWMETIEDRNLTVHNYRAGCKLRRYILRCCPWDRNRVPVSYLGSDLTRFLLPFH